MFVSPVDPTPQQLRQFGLATLVMVPLLAWWFGAQGMVLGWVVVSAAVFAALAWYRPRAVSGVYRGILWVTRPLGAVLGEAALLSLFLLVFWPIGVCLRWTGRDPLRLRADPTAGSYWLEHPTDPAIRRYLRQY